MSGHTDDSCRVLMLLGGGGSGQRCINCQFLIKERFGDLFLALAFLQSANSFTNSKSLALNYNLSILRWGFLLKLLLSFAVVGGLSGTHREVIAASCDTEHVVFSRSGKRNYPRSCWSVERPTPLRSPFTGFSNIRESVDGKEAVGDCGSGSHKGDGPAKAATKSNKKEKRKVRKAKVSVQLAKQKGLLEKLNPKNRAIILGTEKVYKGRGDYGEDIGRNLGSKLGGWVGGKLHNFIRTIFGSGDYSGIQLAGDSKPSSNSFVAGSGVPSMHNNSAGEVRISHHEWVGKMPLDEFYGIKTFDINVADPITFPWLSTIARNFQQYRIEGMIIFFKTLSSDSVMAPTQGMGAVFGAVRYDTNSDTPGSQREIMSSVFSGSGKPSTSLAFPVECSRSQTQAPVLKVQQPGSAVGDRQFYSMGYFDIGSEGCNPCPEGGEIIITYDVTLMKPRDTPASIGLMYFMDTASTITALLTPKPDTIAVKQPRVNTIGLRLDTANYGNLVFPTNLPAGSVWLCSFHLSGDPTANLANLTFVSGNGMSEALVFGDQEYSYFGAPTVSGTNSGMDTISMTFVVKYDGTGTAQDPPYVGWHVSSGSTVPSNQYAGNVMIIRIDGNCNSGITSTPSPQYTRLQFFQYLCDAIAGKNVRGPPGDARLVDWVAQFKLTGTWPINKPVPRCAARFELTLVEAVTAISCYTGTRGVDVTTPRPALSYSCARMDCDCVEEVCSSCNTVRCGKATGKCRCETSQHDYQDELAMLTQRLDALRASACAVYERKTVPIPNKTPFNTDDDVDSDGAWSESIIPPKTGRTKPRDGKLVVGEKGAGSHKGDGPLSDSSAPVSFVGSVGDDEGLVRALESQKEPRTGPQMEIIMRFCTVVDVNPPGLGGTMQPIRIKIAERVSAGWKSPGMSMIRMRPGNTWLWMNPARLLDKKLLRQDPKNRWTINKVRQVQCLAITGKECDHAVYCCPGSKDIIESDALEQMDSVTKMRLLSCLNGCGGSVTNSDDVKVSVCSPEACHNHPTHYHLRRKPKENGAPAKPGAAQRIAKAKIKDLRLCKDAFNQANPLVDGVCGVFNLPHYHVTEAQRAEENALRANQLAEDAIQDAVDDRLPADQFQPIIDRLLRERVQDREEKEPHRVPAQVPAPARAQRGQPNGRQPVVDNRALLARNDDLERRLAVQADIIRAQNLRQAQQPVVQQVAQQNLAAEQHAERVAQAAANAANGFVVDGEGRDRALFRLPPPAGPAANPGDGGRPPVNPNVPVQPVPINPVPIAAAAAELTPAQRAAKHLRDLYNKSATMRLYKDNGSSLDRQVIVRSLATIARKGEIHELVPDVAERIVAIDNLAAADIMEARILGAKVRSVARRPRSSLQRIFLWATQPWDYSWFRSDCRELDHHEAVEPFSKIELSPGEYLCVGIAGVAVMYGLSKVTKYFANRVASAVSAASKAVTESIVWSIGKVATRESMYSAAELFVNSACCVPRNAFFPKTFALDFTDLFKDPENYKRDEAIMLERIRVFSETSNTKIHHDIVSDPAQREARMKFLVYSVLGAPIVEELGKRAFRRCVTYLFPSFKGSKMCKLFDFYSGACFGLVESKLLIIQRGFNEGTRRMCFRMLGHGLLTTLPLAGGIFGHASWNFGCAVFELNRDREVLRRGVGTSEVPTSDPLLAMQLPLFGTVIAILATVAASLPYRSYEFGQRVIEDICLDEHNMPIARTQPGFKVKWGEAVCEPAHGATGSWGIAGFVGTVFRSCHHNERISLCGRVGKFLPAHINPRRTRAIYTNWCRLTESTMHRLSLLPDRLVKQYKPMEYEAWCATFVPRRRDMLLQIAADGVDMPALIAKSFIKKEIAVKDEACPVFKDPRWIQGCPPELSARVGPYLRKWCHKFRDSVKPDWTAHGVRRGQQIVYTCGMNAQEIGHSFAKSIELITEMLGPNEHIVFVEDDQSRYDLHLLKGPFRLLSHVYRKYLPRRVAQLLQRKLSRGTSNLGTKYSVEYTMQSGWPDTSLGDTICNAAMKYEIHAFGGKWISIICGDDSVTITTDIELARCGGIQGIVDSYADYGMEVEALVRDDPLDVEFCSGRFYPCSGSYCLMPRIGKILSKICWDMTSRNLSNRLAWLRSISQTMLDYGQIDPLLMALGLMLKREVGDGRVIDTGDKYKYYVTGVVYKRPSPFDVAVYYDHHYQLSASDIASLRNVILSSRVGSFVDDPRLAEMARYDL